MDDERRQHNRQHTELQLEVFEQHTGQRQLTPVAPLQVLPALAAAILQQAQRPGLQYPQALHG